MFRFGIMGAGGIAAKFCDAVRRLEGAEVAAVASKSVERAEQMCIRDSGYTPWAHTGRRATESGRGWWSEPPRGRSQTSAEGCCPRPLRCSPTRFPPAHPPLSLIHIYLCEPVVVTVDNYKEMLLDSGYYTEDQLK